MKNINFRTFRVSKNIYLTAIIKETSKKSSRNNRSWQISYDMILVCAILAKTSHTLLIMLVIWHKEFNSGPCKVCGGQPLKNLKGYGLLEEDHAPSNFSKAIRHKFYLVHSWILCPIYPLEVYEGNCKICWMHERLNIRTVR